MHSSSSALRHHLVNYMLHFQHIIIYNAEQEIYIDIFVQHVTNMRSCCCTIHRCFHIVMLNYLSLP